METVTIPKGVRMPSHFENIMQSARTLEPMLRQLREEFHRHPELSGEEYRTSARIGEVLVDEGLEIMDLGLETGIVARLPGEVDAPTVALRADIDALPLAEQTGLAYASETPGLMHACAHDAHIAWGLGAAVILSRMQDRPPGEIRFLFQPSEEKTSGARVLIDAGALEGVDYIFGGHNKPDLPSGVVGIAEGYLMASSGRFSFTLVGRGGHGAIPHLTIDPIPAAATALAGMQTIVSRNVSPLDSAVVSVGSVHAGTAGNIIPSEVEITGTMRSFRPEVGDLVETRLREQVEGAARAHGCRVKWTTLSRGVAAVNNHPGATGLARDSMVALLGEDNVVEAVPVMASEDFSLYQEEVPGCFLWIGSGYADSLDGPGWHHPEFAANPDCIPIGAAVLAASAIGALSAQ